MKTTSGKVLLEIDTSLKDAVVTESGFKYYLPGASTDGERALIAQNVGVAFADQGGGEIKTGDIVYYVYTSSLDRYQDLQTNMPSRYYYIGDKRVLLIDENEVIAYDRNGHRYLYGDWCLFIKVDDVLQSDFEGLEIPDGFCVRDDVFELWMGSDKANDIGLEVGARYIVDKRLMLKETIFGREVYATRIGDGIMSVLVKI